MELHLPLVPGCGALPRLPSPEPGEQAEGQWLQNVILPPAALQGVCQSPGASGELFLRASVERSWLGRPPEEAAGWGPRGGGRRPWDQLQLAQGGPCTSVPGVPAHSVALFGKHKGPWYGLKPGPEAWASMATHPTGDPFLGGHWRQTLGDGGEGSEMMEAKLGLEDSVTSDEHNDITSQTYLNLHLYHQSTEL